MKKILLHFSILAAVLLSLQWSCGRDDDDETLVETKSQLFRHNYVLVSTPDGSAAQVEVSYSVYTDLSAENIVKTEQLTTPFVIGGEPVMVKYDSLYTNYGYNNLQHNKLRKDYTEKGADYLVIKNLSGTALQYAVVSNEPIKYFSRKEVNSNPEIANKNEVDISKILKYHPQPIYKGTPVLYLFKPELAPQTDVYVYWERIMGSNQYDYTVYIKKFPLKTPTFGELTLTAPMPITDVLILYKDEFANGNILFNDYTSYHAHTLNITGRSLKTKYENQVVKWYGTIPAGATFTNNGQLWFVNTKDGDTGRTVFGNNDMWD